MLPAFIVIVGPSPLLPAPKGVSVTPPTAFVWKLELALIVTGPLNELLPETVMNRTPGEVVTVNGPVPAIPPVPPPAAVLPISR